MSALPLTHIPLDPPPEGRVQRPSSRDDRITVDKSYFARIHGVWFFGGFTEVWFGWTFNGWVNPAGYQLNCIEDLYEVDITPLLMTTT